MPVSDAERLRAAGHTVTLGEDTFPLVYDFAACLLLEQEFGGFAAITGKLRWAGSHVFADIETFLTCGLAHVPVTREQVRAGVHLDEMKTYQDAIVAALSEAFPGDGDQGKAGSGEQNGSTGEPSTSSRPSAMAAPATSSGA